MTGILILSYIGVLQFPWLDIEPKIGGFTPPKWMVYLMVWVPNPMNKWMIWGVFPPLYLETSIGFVVLFHAPKTQPTKGGSSTPWFPFCLLCRVLSPVNHRNPRFFFCEALRNHWGFEFWMLSLYLYAKIFKIDCLKLTGSHLLASHSKWKMSLATHILQVLC